MNVAMRVSETIEEYMVSCQSRGDRPNTLRSKRSALDKLLNDRRVGNILIRNVGPAHIDSVFESMRQSKLSTSSINTYRGVLINFFHWCQRRRYISAVSSPMDGTRNLRSVPRERILVPVGKFPHLLDCAEHPRDRVIVALGLYLFLRQSEARTLTVQDVDLDSGRVNVAIHKTSQRDLMPISRELDVELRRWFTRYSEVCGNLEPGWALVPTRSRPQFKSMPGTKLRRIDDGQGLNPLKPLQLIERPIQAALQRAGFDTLDSDGASNYEGMHTLRRSGARALFDTETSQGHDGAIRLVQSMLHHKSSEMTERYLGITADVHRRDDRLRGKAMYPGVADGSVVSLPARRAAQ